MDSVLAFIGGVLVIVIGLAVSIGLHEFGHLYPAKKFGVAVDKFFIGFGKTLFSKKIGETEYGVKALPLGGFVSIQGVYVDTPDAKETPEGKRPFYALATWKKLVVMFGGPFMNLVLAVFFYAVLMIGIGLPQYVNTVAAVSPCVGEIGQTECSADDPVSPAAAAGLQAGDEIVAINGEPVNDWASTKTLIADSAGIPLSVDVRRDGEMMNLTVTPVAADRLVTDERGQVVSDASGESQVAEVGVVGVQPAVENVRSTPAAVFVAVGDNIAQVFTLILNLPQRMIDVTQAAFGTEERDANGPISVLGVGRAAGEIAAEDQLSTQSKVQLWLGILASLNVALLAFNLLPLVPLDGGHMAAALYEGGRRQFAKMRGKPEPGHVNSAKLMPITYAVIIVMGTMSVLLMYADIVKPVNLFG